MSKLHIYDEDLRDVLCFDRVSGEKHVFSKERATCVLCLRLAYLKSDAYREALPPPEGSAAAPCGDCGSPTPEGLKQADRMLEALAFIQRVASICGVMRHEAMQNVAWESLIDLHVAISVALGACDRCAGGGFDFDTRRVAHVFYERAVSALVT